MATNLQDAISDTQSFIAVYNPQNKLKAAIDLFNGEWFKVFGSDSEAGQRTVRDWAVQCLVTARVTPNSGNAQQKQDVINIIARVLYATEAAEIGGRITSAESAAMLTAWNNSIGPASPL